MPKPHLSRNVALSALLSAMLSIAANIYVGANGNPKLANLLFICAVLSMAVFVAASLLWFFTTAWLQEPDRPGQPMPGPAPGKKPPARKAPLQPQPPQKKP